jgi:hypothetical protein
MDRQHWLKDLAVVNEAMKTVCIEERIRNFKVGMVMKFLSKMFNFDSAPEIFRQKIYNFDSATKFLADSSTQI